jgi:uncharacterized membrane protein YdjX (TVP38/TMEM64 family)
MTQKRHQLLIKGAILALFLVLLLLLSRYGPQPATVLRPLGGDFENLEQIYSHREKLRRFLVILGPYSSAVFVLLQALQVILSPIPGELTGVVGGYIYGTTFGFILSTIGLTLGSWIAFELARIFGRPFVERWTPREFLEKFHFLTTKTGAMICFVLFLIPGLPKDYLCYVLGLSPMRLTTFLLISTVARLPGTYLLTLQGASIRNQEYTGAVAISAIAVVAFFLAYLYRAPLVQWIKSRAAVNSMNPPE